MKKWKDLTQRKRMVLIGAGIAGGCIIGGMIYRKGKLDALYRIAKAVDIAELIYPTEVQAFNTCMNTLAEKLPW